MLLNKHSEIKPEPAPWNLTGEGWIFLLHQPFSEEPTSLPPGSVASWEASALSAQFHGGYGAVLIVRYQNSNVGPYDELIYIPGWFSDSQEAARAAQYRHTITRIYVSTAESVKNGRRNWGIPKHQAIFDFSPIEGHDGTTRVTVAHSNSPNEPFFQAVLSDSRLTPFSMPVSTSWVDSAITRALTGNYKAQLVQPPLPSAVDAEDGKLHASGTAQDPSWLVGTQKSWLVKPVSTGRSRLCSIRASGDVASGEAGREGYFGDGESFPRFQPKFNNYGLHLVNFNMQFVEPVEV